MTKQGQNFLLLAFIFVFSCSSPGGASRLQTVRTWSNEAFPARPFFSVAGRIFLVTSKGEILEPSGSPRQQLKLILPSAVSASPVIRGSTAILFCQDGSIREFDPFRMKADAVASIDSPVLDACADFQGRIFMVSREGILYSLAPAATNLSILGYAGWPEFEGMTVNTDRLQIENIDGVRSILPFRRDGSFAGELKLKPGGRPAIPEPETAVISNVRFELAANRLVSVNTQGVTVVERSPLSRDLSYRMDVSPPWLFLRSVSGPSFLMKLQRDNAKPGIETAAVMEKTWTNSQAAVFELVFTAGDLTIRSSSNVFEVPDAGFTCDQIRDIRSVDLDSDNCEDCVIAAIDNATLAYYSLVVLKSEDGSSPLVQRFTTIDYRSFKQTFPDLDGDGRREMILNREMLINFSKNLDQRLLVPDVYSLSRDGYRWDSISYPEFFAVELPNVEADAGRRPFWDEERNMLWENLNNEVFRLETQLISLNRQMKELAVRERDERNRQGLSIWFYKKGVECYVNRWDNLALFAFRKSLEMNRENSLALFQVTRIYCDHGLFNRALSVRRNPSPAGVVCLENRDYYSMTEEQLPVVFEPGDVFRNMNLGSVYYENNLYADAVRFYEDVLKSASEDETDFVRKAKKRISECRFAQNEFKSSLKILLSIPGYEKDPELAYRAGLISRLIRESAGDQTDGR